jgi:hypothetical protein
MSNSTQCTPGTLTPHGPPPTRYGYCGLTPCARCGAPNTRHCRPLAPCAACATATAPCQQPLCQTHFGLD